MQKKQQLIYSEKSEFRENEIHETVHYNGIIGYLLLYELHLVCTCIRIL